MNLSPEALAAAKDGNLDLLRQAVYNYTLASIGKRLEQDVRKHMLSASELFKLEDMGRRVRIVNCYGFTTTHVSAVMVNCRKEVWDGYVDKEGTEIAKPERPQDYLVLKNGATEVSNRLSLG